MSEPQLAPYSIKRQGTNLRDCEAEPIRTPGCIQGHGALMVLRRSDLTILQVSDNWPGHFQASPEHVLGRQADAVLSPQHVARLRECVDHDPIERNPIYLFSIEAPGQEALDVSVHSIGEVVLVEFEPCGRGAPDAAPDYFSIVKKTSARLQAAPDLDSFCTTAADEVRKVTGLDRVMIYRFHPDASGEVFAESKREDLPAWKGQRYPAYDVPKIARDIYKQLTVRPLSDAQAELSELTPLANPDNGQPTELTHCALRGASVMYTEYLANMRVAASLTMPILRNGELWGLVAGHHSTPKRFPYQIRAAAEFIAHLMTLELRGAEERQEFRYARHIEAIHSNLLLRAATEGGINVLAEPQPAIIEGIESSGAAMFHRDRWWTVGRVPQPVPLESIGKWVRERLLEQSVDRPCYATDRLAEEFPGAAVDPATASGLLAVAVSKNCHNLILWFRPETVETISWGGNPYDKPLVTGPNGPRLTPRASFDAWKETVRGRSRPWKPVEIDAALKLRLAIMDLVVSRAEQLAALNSDLAKSNAELDAFAYVASHDLKEPLRGIHKYASYLLEDARAGRIPDQAAKERLDSLLRLTVRMDSLLNSLLLFSRLGRLQLEQEDIAMVDLVREALEMLGPRVDEANALVVVQGELPRIRGDRVRLREVLTNLISNALKYNDGPRPRVEIGRVDPAAEPVRGPVDASNPIPAGHHVFYVRDNGIGIDPRHHAQIFQIFKRLHPRDAYGGGTGAGLSIARRLIEQHGGLLWVDSTPGVGSTFYFTVSSR